MVFIPRHFDADILHWYLGTQFSDRSNRRGMHFWNSKVGCVVLYTVRGIHKTLWSFCSFTFEKYRSFLVILCLTGGWYLSCESGSAPLSSNSFAIIVLFHAAARIKGVQPSFERFSNKRIDQSEKSSENVHL